MIFRNNENLLTFSPIMLLNCFSYNIAMNKNDMLIVSHLRKDARAPILSMSSTLQLCRVTITQRLRKLQRTIIHRYTALIDFRKLGFSVRIVLCISLASYDKDIFCRYIQQHPCVNNLYHAVQGADYLVEMLFPTQEEAEHFLTALDSAFSIVKQHVYYLDQEIIRESFFPDPKTAQRVVLWK